MHVRAWIRRAETSNRRAVNRTAVADLVGVEVETYPGIGTVTRAAVAERSQCLAWPLSRQMVGVLRWG